MRIADRLTRGFFAGVAAGIVADLFDLFSYYVLHLAKLLHADWTGLLIYGYRPSTPAEVVLAFAVQLFVTGVVGIGFVYLVPLVTSRKLYLKGWIYSQAVWIFIYSATDPFGTDQLAPIKPDTVLSNIIGSVIYGLVLVWLLTRLDQRTGTEK